MMSIRLTLFLLLVSFGTSLSAADYTYQAVEDFPDITSGEIPFYIDTVAQRNVLAINAANPDFRNRFASASLQYTGIDGDYNITLTSLGEVDGECEYQLLVNGELIGQRSNTRVHEDYVEQTHIFEGVSLQTGDQITVNSMAVSNGLIPEGDGYAFARGRWRSLALDAVPEPESITVDLSLAFSNSPTEAEVGTEHEFIVTAGNLADSYTATGVQINVTLPEQMGFISSALCTVDNQTLTCELPELPPHESSAASFTLGALFSGTASLHATISSDQSDVQADNNQADWVVQVTPTETAEEVPQANEPETQPADTPENNGSAGGSQFLLPVLLSLMWIIRRRTNGNR